MIRPFSAVRLGAAGLNLFQGLTAAGELFHDRVHGGSPNKGLGIVVPRLQELHDGLLQLLHAEKNTATHPFARQFSKPAFHQIEPTRTGGYKVTDEAGMPLQPSSNRRMFMRAV